MKSLTNFDTDDAAERVILGLMSGSSVDGIDVAAVRLRGCCEGTEFELADFMCVPFDRDDKRTILQLFQYETSTVEDVCLADVLLGELFAEAALALLSETGRSPDDIHSIGVWPQMVYHLPGRTNPVQVNGRELGAALQLGNLDVIAERTGITTVGSFCARDIAAGGNGAPLTGLGDRILYHDASRNRVVQNIGGIANANFVPKNAEFSDVIGFDTGPGNMVIDEAVRTLTDGELEFDRDGRFALAGAPQRELVEEFLSNSFIQRDPPKATGREDFGEEFTRAFLDRARALNLSLEDTIASATSLTVEAILLNYRRHFIPRGSLDEVVVGGGGASNPAIMKMLRDGLPSTRVSVDDDYGVPSEAKEAIYMAFLANEALLGHPNNVPSVTGAAHPVVMGTIARGSSTRGTAYGL